MSRKNTTYKVSKLINIMLKTNQDAFFLYYFIMLLILYLLLLIIINIIIAIIINLGDRVFIAVNLESASICQRTSDSRTCHIKPFQTVAEDVFIWVTVGPKHTVNPRLTALYKSSCVLSSMLAGSADSCQT